MTKVPSLDKLLGALADENTLRIFHLASVGLKGGESMRGQLQMSRKQFYTRVGSLVDLGLIAKTEGLYKQTGLGVVVENTQIRPLERALASYWVLKGVDELKQSKTIPQQEQYELIRRLVTGTSLSEYIGQPSSPPLRMTKSFSELVQEVLRLIALAKHEIYIASRYYEPQVSLRLMEKGVDGVVLNILDDNSSGVSLTSRLQIAVADPAKQKLAKQILESPKVRIRSNSLEYSFMVVDGLYCMVEVADPINPNEFNLAVAFEDADLSKRMVRIFEAIWATAEVPAHADESQGSAVVAQSIRSHSVK